MNRPVVIPRIAAAFALLAVPAAYLAAPARAEFNSKWTLANAPPASCCSFCSTGLRGGFCYPSSGGIYPNYLGSYYAGPSCSSNFYSGVAYGANGPPFPEPPPSPKVEDIPAPKPAAAAKSSLAPPAEPGDVAEIDLRVPADAELWFQGIKVKQTGTVRMLVTPPLKSGRSYGYEIRATYSDNGRDVTTVRSLRVHAGDRLQALLIALPVVPSSTTATVSSRQ